MRATKHNDYYQGYPERTVIQRKNPEGGWIVWNWRVQCWDNVPGQIDTDGRPVAQ